jgi:hypothetical protein
MLLCIFAQGSWGFGRPCLIHMWLPLCVVIALVCSMFDP